MKPDQIRDCICADPENCTEPVPGYRCRRRVPRDDKPHEVTSTPRTDAHLEHLNLPDGKKIGIPDITLELMRGLERDAATWKAKAKRWQQIADQRAIEVADLKHVGMEGDGKFNAVPSAERSINAAPQVAPSACQSDAGSAQGGNIGSDAGSESATPAVAAPASSVAAIEPPKAEFLLRKVVVLIQYLRENAIVWRKDTDAIAAEITAFLDAPRSASETPEATDSMCLLGWDAYMTAQNDGANIVDRMRRVWIRMSGARAEGATK